MMGKKNQSMDFGDFLARQMRQVDNPVYCRYCGIDVKRPSMKQPEVNWSQDLAWEEQYHAHRSCHMKHTVKEKRGY